MVENLTYKPVTRENWHDLELLFESKGGPHYCWCMPWREMEQGKSRNSKSDKKEALKNSVNDNIPVGLLAYDDSNPIAWCSIAPRDTYRALGGDETIENVWSLVCFFIKKEYRGRHLTELLINEAVNYAKRNGAKYLEAYPVDPHSPSYRYMGYKSTFERMGFTFKHMAGKRRNVMLLDLAKTESG
jgi:GNAT superfamily N-acetyltransferase